MYEALKRAVFERGLVRGVWITKTHCLGLCPKRGATVACVANGETLHAEVEPEDGAALLDRAIERSQG